MAADRDGIDVGRINIMPAEHHLALDLETAHQVIHAVEAAQRGTLAASGRPDKGSYSSLDDTDSDVAHRFESAVVKLLDFAVEQRLRLHCRRSVSRRRLV